MPPLIASWDIDVLKEVFSAVGIHVLEQFPDGQMRLGNAPLTKPYGGLSVVIAPYICFEGPRFLYDIFTLRNAAHRLQMPQAEADMNQRLLGYSAKSGSQPSAPPATLN